MPSLKKTHARRRAEGGQSLVEFSASLVVLLLVLMAVLDIGRAFYAYVAIENAPVREFFLPRITPLGSRNLMRRPAALKPPSTRTSLRGRKTKARTAWSIGARRMSR